MTGEKGLLTLGIPAYPAQAGHDKPFVTQCDTATGDNFWSGAASSAQTAYIKRRYTPEYMAACLSMEQGNPDRTAVVLSECRRLDVRILEGGHPTPAGVAAIARGPLAQELGADH